MPSVTNALAGGGGSVAPRFAKKLQEFQSVIAVRSGRTAVRALRLEEIRPILQAARTAIGTAMADEEVVERVALKQPDALWAFIRNQHLVGCLALLMLNAAGVEALLSDRIDFRNPASVLLADTSDTPAAIYVWAVFAPGLAVDGVAEVILRLRGPRYDSANIYAFQATEEGANLLRRLGFHPVSGCSRKLYEYVRLANRPH
jgi:hypothetical protein